MSATLLTHLRTRSRASADTLDAAVVARLGPFQDATSNQAIALGALTALDSEHGAVSGKDGSVLEEAARIALQYAKAEELAVEEVSGVSVDVATILLARRLLPHLRGRVHVQVDPRGARSEIAVLQSARRLVQLYRRLNGETASSDPPAGRVPPAARDDRLVIKVPATHQGLRACQTLEREGVVTLATMLFSPAQAILAGAVGCTYIAPYVYDLRVHFDTDFTDPAPAFSLVAACQRHYARMGHQTRTLPASLISVADCMRLAGADDITIAPQLLEKLATTPVYNGSDEAKAYASVFDEPAPSDEEVEWSGPSGGYDEEGFNRAMGGEAQKKLAMVRNIYPECKVWLQGTALAFWCGMPALDLFCECQRKLEDLMAPYVQDARDNEQQK